MGQIIQQKFVEDGWNNVCVLNKLKKDDKIVFEAQVN